MLGKALDSLIRGTGNELPAYLKEISANISLPKTQIKTHFYHVQLDGNGNNRVLDFIEFIASRIVEYSIPRSEFEKARKYLNEHQSDAEFAKLRKKASELFVDVKNTGEGGEILLYILVQEYLRIPQLLCKMPLKTSTQMYYHGVDGIHAEYDSQSDMLALYWGESKLYQNIGAGLKSCFDSLKEYLINPNTSTSPQHRDVELIHDYLDLNDTKLQDAIVQYFDRGNEKFNKVNYRGVCLVGFDSTLYPSNPNQLNSDSLNSIFLKEIEDWKTKIIENIETYDTLNSFIIHVFLIPFPSVEDFRLNFLKAIKIP